MGIRGRTLGRIIISYPTHPAFLWAYLLVGIVLALLFSGLPTVVADASEAADAHILATLAVLLIVLSPPLSFINAALAEINVGATLTEIGVDYVEFFGIPIPIPRVRTREVSTILAINFGGAVVPIAASVIFAYLLSSSSLRGVFMLASLIDVVVTSIIIYFLSRPVAGVGIVVPAFMAPLIAALVAVVTAGFGVVAATAAYIGGSIGSLIGADVLRLSRSLSELKAPMLSIGGAGIFDGVFLSGILAFVLAL